MKKQLAVLFIVLLVSCTYTANKKPVLKNTSTQENSNFFPVTAYIKGQIRDIKQKGLTPIKLTTINHHTDSTAVKLDDLNTELQQFLSPEIDSTNLVLYFTESKFLDQSIAAFTFTYDAKPNLPPTLLLKHWDVYIDPATNKVTRIYMLKRWNKDSALQLTWQSNEWCKSTTISTAPNGNSRIEKEEKISWNY